MKITQSKSLCIAFSVLVAFGSLHFFPSFSHFVVFCNNLCYRNTIIIIIIYTSKKFIHEYKKNRDTIWQTANRISVRARYGICLFSIYSNDWSKCEKEPKTCFPYTHTLTQAQIRDGRKLTIPYSMMEQRNRWRRRRTDRALIFCFKKHLGEESQSIDIKINKK